jgi:hypothetical protein
VVESEMNLHFEEAVGSIASLDVYGAILLQGFARRKTEIIDDLRIVDTPDEF